MVLSRFFKKEDRWSNLHHSLSNSISKIKSDMFNFSGWLYHFKEKHDENEEHHDVFIEHLEHHKKAIFYLNQEIENLKKRLEISENFPNSIKGQVGTPHGTFQGQVKDMSRDKKDVAKDTKIQFFNKDLLKGSHVELLNLLYSSDRALSYQDIAKLLGKKEKSIRNLIYEIREKGLNIRTKPVGIRTRGFYLDKEEKIKVSGR